MRNKKRKLIGLSYAAKVMDVNAIYEEHARSGLSNREIWRRYIYPKYFMCERTFYNLINASANDKVIKQQNELSRQLSLF
ncbi:MAG: hypothetical protein ACRCUJ_01690 [Phocaeicola sp.]